MTQPHFVPVADVATVRPSIPTPTPETGRPKKPGLLGAPRHQRVRGQGTPGPDGGYALTVTHAVLEQWHGDHIDGVDHHDLVAGVAALASKRAGLFGRGPSRSDVEVALRLIGVSAHSASISPAWEVRFAGIGHSYFRLRDFVDAVGDEFLRVSPADASTLSL
ncbi:MAG: hypothetical protein KJS64_03570 [Acidobacteria bacterium]|nr:hypothetical protein [Acidobacteriota bacterium]